MDHTQIELAYWNGRGLMEVPRMLLAISGQFPGDYKDGRYDSPAKAGNLNNNLGRMPLLTIEGETVGQITAINFFLASELGLMGKNTMQAAQILSIAEHLKEMTGVFNSLTPGFYYGTEPDANALDMWFDGGATDTSPSPADFSSRSTRYLCWWMGRIEHTVGSDGCAVGDSLSLADVLIYNSFSEHLEDSESAEGVPQYRKGAFGSKERTDAALAKHPKLQKICQEVAKNKNIQKWMETRGTQGF